MVNAWLSRPIDPSATERPMTAVRIGSPMATMLPNVMARMIIAAARPTASLVSVGEDDSAAPIVAPTATSMPCFWAGFVASKIRWARASVTWPLLMFNNTGVNAYWPLLLTSPADGFLNGSVAE
jgi:hypothetical protein